MSSGGKEQLGADGRGEFMYFIVSPQVGRGGRGGGGGGGGPGAGEGGGVRKGGHLVKVVVSRG